MLRLVEIGWFVLPFAVFGLWLALRRLEMAWPAAAVAAIAGIAALATATIWFGFHRAAPPGSVYVPAHMENGAVVPGIAQPPK